MAIYSSGAGATDESVGWHSSSTQYSPALQSHNEIVSLLSLQAQKSVKKAIKEKICFMIIPGVHRLRYTDRVFVSQPVHLRV